MFSNLPVSLSWFALTAVVYVLQLIPFTGIFLMLVAAPFWSVILVNAGFVSLALEALARPHLRLWLLAPALYFGCYLYFANISQQRFAQIDAEFRAFNAGKAVVFNPAAHDLVVEEKTDGLKGAARTLVSRYNLDVAYQENPNFKTASHLAYRVAQSDVCITVRKNPEAKAAFVHAYGLGKKHKSLCSLTGPEDPSRPAVRVSSQRSKHNDWLVPATIDTLTVRTLNGRTVELKTGYAAPLPWIPMPAMGCALNSGAPSWDCFSGFIRFGKKGLGAPGRYGQANVPVVATALGLREITDAELETKAVGRLPAGLMASIAMRAELSLANLEKVIADPSVKLTYHDLKGLHHRPDLWQNRAPEMVDTLARAFDGGSKTRERARMLQDLLNKLPARDYLPIGEKILAVITARPQLDLDDVRSDTLSRLGELGTPAVSVIERGLIRHRERLEKGAVLGLCKIGPQAISNAEKIAALALNERNKRDIDLIFRVYITLLRMGRPDLAENVRMNSRIEKDRKASRVAGMISPSSPKDVCATRHKWKVRLLRSSM